MEPDVGLELGKGEIMTSAGSGTLHRLNHPGAPGLNLTLRLQGSILTYPSPGPRIWSPGFHQYVPFLVPSTQAVLSTLKIVPLLVA